MDAYYGDGGALVADPNNGLVYWSGGELDEMKVSRTTNAGLTWTRYTLAANGYTYALAVDPTNSNIVYAGGDPGMYKTTNSGGVWSLCSSGLSGFVYDIAINPSTTSTLYAATPNGLFKTTNSGTSWVNMGCTNVNAVVLNPDNPAVVYAGTSSGIYESTDAGGSWTPINDGLEDTYITSLDIYPGTYLYCGTGDAGMFRWALNVGIEEHERNSTCLNLVIQPNPVTENATMYYSIPTATHVSLVVYDVTGRKVRFLVDQVMAPGFYTAHWDVMDAQGDPVPTGIYFGRLLIGKTQAVRKFIIVR